MTAKLLGFFCVHLLGHDTVLDCLTYSVIEVQTQQCCRKKHFKYTQYSAGNQLKIFPVNHRECDFLVIYCHVQLPVRLQTAPTGPTHQTVKVGWK